MRLVVVFLNVYEKNNNPIYGVSPEVLTLDMDIYLFLFGWMGLTSR
jgi:hypothetical protein